MIVLLVGGPEAGRVIQAADDTLEVVFAIRGRVNLKWTDDEPDTTVVPDRAVYRPRPGARGRILVGQHIIGFNYQGNDKYAEARTLERVVAFASPYSLAELEDRITVEFLVYECCKKGDDTV